MAEETYDFWEDTWPGRFLLNSVGYIAVFCPIIIGLFITKKFLKLDPTIITEKTWERFDYVRCRPFPIAQTSTLARPNWAVRFGPSTKSNRIRKDFWFGFTLVNELKMNLKKNNLTFIPEKVFLKTNLKPAKKPVRWLSTNPKDEKNEKNLL